MSPSATGAAAERQATPRDGHVPDEVLEVPFAGGRSGDSPLTWGQLAIWHAIGRTAPNDHYFNLGRVLPLADRGAPVDTARLSTALSALLVRHEALRTRVVAEEGEPAQRLHPEGRAQLVVRDEPDPDRTGETAAALLAELSGHRFDYAREWPVRLGAVRSGGRITHAVLALCHLAADGHAAEILVRDLRLLVRRGAAGPVCPETPLDLARHQHGPAGRRARGGAGGPGGPGGGPVPPPFVTGRGGGPRRA
ncbi:condensation domain-containing protein, partial [Streptomyces sp. NPDC059810]|uniref:condensation domain-containing protein n=1 Tax=Streptomyces sp. NPDC059810 TaxID=3346956 RepID=UPI00365728C6